MPAESKRRKNYRVQREFFANPDAVQEALTRAQSVVDTLRTGNFPPKSRLDVTRPLFTIGDDGLKHPVDPLEALKIRTDKVSAAAVRLRDVVIPKLEKGTLFTINKPHSNTPTSRSDAALYDRLRRRYQNEIIPRTLFDAATRVKPGVIAPSVRKQEIQGFKAWVATQPSFINFTPERAEEIADLLGLTDDQRTVFRVYATADRPLTKVQIASQAFPSPSASRSLQKLQEVDSSLRSRLHNIDLTFENVTPGRGQAYIRLSRKILTKARPSQQRIGNVTNEDIISGFGPDRDRHR